MNQSLSLSAPLQFSGFYLCSQCVLCSSMAPSLAELGHVECVLECRQQLIEAQDVAKLSFLAAFAWAAPAGSLFGSIC